METIQISPMAKEEKLWHIYVMEYHVAIRKGESLQFAASGIEWEGIELSEEESQIADDLTHLWHIEKNKEISTVEEC